MSGGAKDTAGAFLNLCQNVNDDVIIEIANRRTAGSASSRKASCRTSSRDAAQQVCIGVVRSSVDKVSADNSDRQEGCAGIDVEVFVLFVEEELTLEITIREGDDVIGSASTTKLGN